MNVGMKARQFLNVVTEKCNGDLYSRRRVLGSYSLRRVEASDHFYGSTEEAVLKEAEQEAMAATDPSTKVLPRSRLPKPRIKFKQSRPVDGRMDFWPFYGGAANESSKIVCVDAAGQAVLYDAGAVTLETLPRLREPMGSVSYLPPVALSVALPDAHDALYVMDQKSGSFEALVYGSPSPSGIGRNCPDAFVWRWRQLPMPLFVREPSHSCIASYALLPDGTICVSSMGDKVGTYSFDTVGERWTKAGSWKLPFCGRAHVVPELDGLCFGVTGRSPSHLCAVDFSSISMDDADSGRQPKLRHQWLVWDKPDWRHWMLTSISVAYMGAGKFCVAQTFCIEDKDIDRFVYDQTVLTGVEVVRQDNGGSTQKPKLHVMNGARENGRRRRKWKSNLQMIRHKSVRYGLLNHRINVM